VHEGVEMRVVIRGLHQRGMAFDTRSVNCNDVCTCSGRN
jgi:hypothetical protein